MTNLPAGLTKRQLVRSLALVVLAIAIIWWFGRGLDWPKVWSSLSNADWRLLITAILIISFTYILRAYRWRSLLRPFTNTAIKDLFVANVVGFSAFFFFGRAGEVVRPALLPLRDRKVGTAASFITIFIERICDFVAVVLLFAVNLTWFKAPPGHEIDFQTVRKVGLILLISVLIGLVTQFLFGRYSTPIIMLLDKKLTAWKFVPKRLCQFIIGLVEQLATALKVFASPRELLPTVSWTVLLWLAIVLGNLFVIRAFGLSFGLRETVFMLGWALIGSLVPTPGGAAGAFHATAAAALVFLSVNRELAAAIVIVIHLVDFAPALLFALYYLVRGEVTVARLRDVWSNEGKRSPERAKVREWQVAESRNI
jgi:uncharacterized protein (TIRG00374 family)